MISRSFENIGRRLLGPADIGARDDLHQRDARAVEVDEGHGRGPCRGYFFPRPVRGGCARSARCARCRLPSRPALRLRPRWGGKAGKSGSPAAGRDRSSSLRSKAEFRWISAFSPSPVRTACATQNSLMTGSMPGMPASTKATLELGLGAESRRGAGEELGLSTTTWAWTSMPITSSQSCRAPEMILGLGVSYVRSSMSGLPSRCPCVRAGPGGGQEAGTRAGPCAGARPFAGMVNKCLPLRLRRR